MATLVETQTNPRLAFQNWLLIVNTVRTVIEHWTLDCRANLSPTDFFDSTVLPILRWTPLAVQPMGSTSMHPHIPETIKIYQGRLDSPLVFAVGRFSDRVTIVAPTFGFEFLCMSSGVLAGDGQEADARKQKPLPDQGLVNICHWLTSDVESSGGGTRTPDKRIMILRAQICKPLSQSNLGEPGQVCCTYCCTRVEIGPELAQIIAGWPSLTDQQRQGIAMLAAAPLHHSSEPG